MSKSANAIINDMIREAKDEHDAEKAKRGGLIQFFTIAKREINGSQVTCSCDPFGKAIRWKIDGAGSSKAKVKVFIES